MTQNAPVIAYYDGLCPICCAEMDHYRERSNGLVKTQDCTGPDLPDDIDRDKALKSLHLRLPDGSVVDGWDAFIAIWERTPGLEWLAAINRPWIIRKPMDILYRLIVPFRPRRTCRDGVCER